MSDISNQDSAEVERVAKAIVDARQKWTHSYGDMWDFIARAAIAAMSAHHANGLPVEAVEKVTQPSGQVFYTDGSPSRELSEVTPSFGLWQPIESAPKEGQGDDDDLRISSAEWDKKLTDEYERGKKNGAAENAELREALTAILSDILEYERLNNLAPNLGRENCWDSVTRARALLSRTKGE